MIQRILLAAIAAGIAAGLFVTLVQHWKVIPLIHQAELYEVTDGSAIHSHGLSDIEEAILAEESKQAVLIERTETEDDTWPAEGLERTLYTTGSNIVTGIGLALLLSACILLRGEKIDIKTGTLWGLAGFIAFSFAPVIGLAPEVPGTESAWLDERQNWFYITVIATALSLALIIFGKSWAVKAPGIILIMVPHIMGAPLPDEYAGTAPAPLAAEFAIHSLFASLCFWLVMGVVIGYCFNKFEEGETA